MELFGLTSRGLAISRNPYNPRTSEYRIIACIAATDSNRVTMDKICANTGLSPREASQIIRTRLKGIIARE